MAQMLSVIALGNSEDGDAIQKQIKTWDEEQ